MNPNERKVKQMIMEEICNKMKKCNISIGELKECYEKKEYYDILRELGLEED